MIEHRVSLDWCDTTYAVPDNLKIALCQSAAANPGLTYLSIEPYSQRDLQFMHEIDSICIRSAAHKAALDLKDGY